MYSLHHSNMIIKICSKNQGPLWQFFFGGSATLPPPPTPLPVGTALIIFLLNFVKYKISSVISLYRVHSLYLAHSM